MIRASPQTGTLEPGDGGASEPRPDGDLLDGEAIFLGRRRRLAGLREGAALVAGAPSLARWSAVAARVHGAARLAAVRRLRTLRRRGFEYDEAVRTGLLDPRLSDRDLRGYASRHVALMAQREANPDAFQDLTTEKAIFYRYCAAVGLPTPALLAIVHRGTAGWGAGDRVLDGPDDLEALLAEHPGDVVVKPSDGGKGVAVRVLRREGALLADAAGREPAIPAQELWRWCRSHAGHRCFVIQERVRNRADLAALNPGPSLDTIRLVTLVTRSGRREIVQACLRLGLGGGVTDNYGDGTIGNALAVIDPASGRMGPLRFAGPERAGFVERAAVPGTGIRVEGETLPGWREAVELAHTATGPFLPLRCIGWDIAVTDRGAVIVEANREWTPITQADLLHRLARVARA